MGLSLADEAPGSNGEIKIGDFGWSVHDADGDGSVFWNNFDGSTSTDRASQHTLAGTLSYVAPEIVLGRAYNEAVDIWVRQPILDILAAG